MRRRSRAGGKPVKTRRRKTVTPKRRNASKTLSSSAPIQDAEVARLTRERDEAPEQQAATIAWLIASSKVSALKLSSMVSLLISFLRARKAFRSHCPVGNITGYVTAF